MVDCDQEKYVLADTPIDNWRPLSIMAVTTTRCSKHRAQVSPGRVRQGVRRMESFKFRFNPGGHGLGKVLGRREAEIMDIVWESGSVTVAQVCDLLRGTDKLAYTTIMTIMARLEKKGLLRRTTDGKAHVYRAAFTKEEFGASIVSGLLGGILADFTRPALSYFIKNLSAEDRKALDELDRLIRERKAIREE